VLRPLFHTIPQSQHGYRPRFNRITAWQSLLRQWDEVNYALEFDIRKFFDSVDKTQLTKKLLDLGIPPRTISLITNGKYKQLEADGRVTTHEQKTGIPQGYPTSPLLALIGLHCIIELHNSTTYEYLGYADDGIILSQHHPITTCSTKFMQAIATHALTNTCNTEWSKSILDSLRPSPILAEIQTKLNTLSLHLKAKSVRVIKTPTNAKQFTFLGIQRCPEATSYTLRIDSRSGLYRGRPLKDLNELYTLYQTDTPSQKTNRKVNYHAAFAPINRAAILWKTYKLQQLARLAKPLP
jgi:hypothetical protein